MTHVNTTLDPATEQAPDISRRIQGLLVAHAGACPASAAELRWQDIDFAADTIRLFNPRTGCSRTATSTPRLKMALSRWKEEQRRIAETHPRIKEALANPDTARVLLDTSGDPLAPAAIALNVKWLKAARIAALMHLVAAEIGERQVSPHPADCPVCACSNEIGVNLRVLADTLYDRFLRRRGASNAVTSEGRISRLLQQGP